MILSKFLIEAESIRTVKNAQNQTDDDDSRINGEHKVKKKSISRV
jgi:hypothetical protein